MMKRSTPISSLVLASMPVLVMVVSLSATAADAVSSIAVSHGLYAPTDSNTFKPHMFQTVSSLSAELVPNAGLGSEIKITMQLPATLVGDQTPDTTLSLMADKNDQMPDGFAVFGPGATGLCQRLHQDVTCKLSYAKSYMQKVDFDKASALSQLEFAKQPAVLKEAMASIRSFGADPEGVFRFRLDQ